MAQNLPLAKELIEQSEVLGPLFNLTGDLLGTMDKVHYRNLFVSRAKYNEAGHYSLTLVTFENLGLNFSGPGGMGIVINPTTIGPIGSEIDVTFKYKWDILKYRHAFDGATFTESIDQIFEIVLDVANITKQDFLSTFLSEFFDNSDNIFDFITDFNLINSEGLTLTANGSNPDVLGELENVIDQFDASEVNVFLSIFSNYLQEATFQDSLDNLNNIFKSFIGEITLEKIQDFVLPAIRMSVDDISIELQFPRLWLIPMIESPLGSGKYIEDPDILELSALAFDVGSLDYSTDSGFTFNNTSVFSFQKSKIANTGFTLEIDDAKIDLWDKKNITEATQDGRPSTFKGVYIETATIGLPQSLTPESGETASIVGTNLLIGTEGGFSGVLALEGQSLRAEIGSLVLELVNFDIQFHQNTVTDFDIKADLFIPGVIATSAGTNSLGQAYAIDDPGPIGLDITYDAPNYTAAVVSEPIIEIFGIKILIHDLTFGFDNDSLNNFVFISEIFIPTITAKSNGTNTHNLIDYSDFLAGQPAPILLLATYSSDPNTFSLEAMNIPVMNVSGFEFTITDLDLIIENSILTTFAATSEILIPGVIDPQTSNPAPIGVGFAYNEVYYHITASNIPELKMFGIGLDIAAIDIKFGGVNSFSLTGELIIPGAKMPADTVVYTNDCLTVVGPGDDSRICFTTGYLDDGTNKTFTLAATDIPEMDIFGLGLKIDAFGFNILNGSMQGFALNSVLTIPGVIADEAGVDSLGNPYAADALAPIGLTVLYNNPDYTITGSNLPDISFFKMELFIHTLSFGINDSGLNGLIFLGEIKIPNLVVPETVNLPADSALNTPLVHGEPAPIGFETIFIGGATNVFSFTVNDIPEITLFGLGFTFNSLGFELDNGALSGFSFNADIDIPGFSGGPIVIGFSYSGITEIYTIALGSNITLEFGSFSFTFDSFDITFTKDAVLNTGIGGTVVMDNNSLIFELEFTGTGWEIYVEDPTGLDFSIPGFVEGAIYGLRLGQRNGNFFVEIGKPSNMDLNDNTLGLKLANLLNIPLVGKYLPSELEIGFLSFEHGSGLDLQNAELKLLWPELEGLEISSTATGLEAVIPINKTIFKTITINTLTVSMSNVDDGNGGVDETNIKAVMDGTLEIGPILGTVSGIGLEATISYPETGGNLGAANIDNFGLTGPDGIGLSIDTAGIKGAGFLSFDKEKGEYAGYLGLTIQDKISLNAIAILNTKFPDGSTGISLLIILTVEFNPGIQLGFGFNLSGLGGLFGLHRTMEIEPLRTGVKTGTIDHILFPDPATFVQNAASHLSNIKSIFPVDHGRFVFGPMAKIGWGAPTLITAELGLLLEVPKPIRLAILGVIKAILPDEDNDLIRLQINFLGMIDFGKKEISFDATIFDSKILTFTISGDMAFRLNYGDKPAFLLSVGGFHPKFNSPIPVPVMNRLMVKVVDRPSIKIILSTYFAVTSNTVQFGAKMDLEAKAGKILAIGYFGLDVLFQFSPFYMIASISAGVAVSYDGFDLLAIHLSGELEGPTPWKVNGTATFSIIGIEKSFSMSEVFGDEKTVTYESVDVHSLLVEAIDDNVNWQVTTSKLQDNNVVLKAQSDATNIISASGTLSITQRVVPLNYTIQKYGNRVPAGPRTFAIASVEFGSGAMADLENIKEDFASAEYKNIDKSTKLSIPSFEKMDGGVKVNPPAGGLDYGGDSVSATSNQRDADYEQTLIDFEPAPVDPLNPNVMYAKSNYSLRDNWLKREVRGGAAAKSQASRTRSKLYGKTDQRVSIEQETFAVVSTDNLSTTYTAKTRLEAAELMETAILADPTLEGQLQIITNHRTI
ncbi:MAG: hypothetical protein ACJASQ_002984 [Crocinitomicaceae bacterium]|jgi:hypothetical protein